MKLTFSNKKTTNRKQKQNRTTKTKCSGEKPTIFSVSMTRNKNNHNPILFGSVKKSKPQPNTNPFQKQNYQQYKSQKKPKKHEYSANIYQDLNTRISINYINSLYSDLTVHLGYKLRQKLQDKQNRLNQRNVKSLVENKQQRQCFQKIKQLFVLKQKINKTYLQMQNSRNIYAYVLNSQQKTKDLQGDAITISDISFKKRTSIHQDIQLFLKQFIQKEQQVKILENELKNIQKQNIHEIQQSEAFKDQLQLKKQEQNLKFLIQKERNLSNKLKYQQKLLIKKLQNTQKKTNEMKNSFSNLKMKNINLRQTLRLSQTLTKNLHQKNTNFENTQGLINENRTLKRSISMKLQKVRQYNIQQNLIACQRTSGAIDQTIEKQNKKLIKSSSTNSLNNGKNTIKLIGKARQTFLDKIN